MGGEEEDVETYALPAEFWGRTGNEARPGYRYRDNDASAGPIKKVVLGRGKMTITAKGDGVYELAGAPQQAMALRLELGTGISFCASAPARSPAEKFDSTRKFDAEKNSPAPVACPPIPGTSSYGSASAAFLAGSPSLRH